MKFKLHNKYEITLGDKTYVAYNTLLKTVYDKIANLQQYTSHIAIGTGQASKTYEDTKLGTYLTSFEAQTEELQCDITQGTLYIKKVVTIEESDTLEFSFSELGLTDTDAFDPVIFNHVLLTNTDGEVVTITRSQGDALQIRVTIYLEISSSSSALFVKGENNFIKQLLGDNLELTDNNIYALRGENLLENKYINRMTPDLTNAVACSKSITYNQDNSITMDFSAELGEGETEEILLVFGGKVCMRLNTLELKSAIETSATYTCNAGNTIEVDKNVKEIVSVVKASDNSSESSYSLNVFGKKLTDKITNLFDQPFSNSTQRFLSKDGKMIAFIYNSQAHIYKYSDYGFTKINSTQVPGSNIMKMFMFEDVILLLLTTSPYIRVYNIIDNNAVEQSTSLSMYNLSVYPYSWLDADATLSENKVIIIGLIINNEDQTPVILNLKQNSSGIYSDRLRTPTITTAKKVFAVYKNSFNQSFVAFLTDTYSGAVNNLMEVIFEDSSEFGGSNALAFGLLSSSLDLQAGGRVTMSRRSTIPYFYIAYYPDYETCDSLFSGSTDFYLSYDGKYVITKDADGNYHIYNFHVMGEATEFETGFPAYVDFENIVDFLFVGDVLLIFTSNANEYIYAIAIKNQYTLLENLSDSSESYIVSYKKYDLLGSKDLEGVKIDLKLTFGTTSQDAESSSDSSAVATMIDETTNLQSITIEGE